MKGSPPTRQKPPALVGRFAQVVRSSMLIGSGEHVLVAVSGGPDSVALLSLLAGWAQHWKLKVSALHINHQLRGQESWEDATFVESVCGRLGVGCWVEQVPIAKDQVRKRGSSLQEVAREGRYAALRKVAKAMGVDKIALGHTANDQAETVLMWMLRGCGLTGLSGMSRVRDAVIVRPLLDIQRADILKYLAAQGLSFREDSSNRNSKYLRNRVRRELVPVLEGLNPAIIHALGRQATLHRADDVLLDQWASQALQGVIKESGRSFVVLDRHGVMQHPMPIQRRLLRLAVRTVCGITRGPSFATVSTLITCVCGNTLGVWMVGKGIQVERTGEDVRLQGRSTRRTSTHDEVPSTGIPLPVPSRIRWPPTDQDIVVTLHNHPDKESRPSVRPQSRKTAVCDADRLTWDLRLRPWSAGDLLHPLGMEGHRKKLQDLFSDLKIPRLVRTTIPLVVAPEGIVWVAGHHQDHRFRVTSSTTRVLHMQLVNGSS